MNIKPKPIFLAIMVGLAAAGCVERATKNAVVDDATQSSLSLAPDIATRAEHDALLKAAVRHRLAAPPAYALADPEAWTAVTAAYDKSGGALLWFEHAAPRAQVAQLRTAIANSAADGLDPQRYALDGADSLEPVKAGFFLQRYEPTPAADADVRLTYAAVLLAGDLQDGLVAPATVDANWIDPEGHDLGALVVEAAAADDAEATLRSLAPHDPQYARLRDALVRYRELATRVEWPDVPETLRVKPGKSSPDVPALRARLVASGHLEPAPVDAATDAASADPTVLDPALQEAVKRFQREHAIADDGVPGASTIAALNVSVESRIRQIELNLERWRWLPEDLGDTHVIVNVPTYQLTAVEDGQTALQMRVVIGKGNTPTPIFRDTMETVVLSPYWNIPSSILKGEVIPGVDKNVGYLASKGMEVLQNGRPVDASTVSLSDPSVRVRQRPGAANALGHVKFLFPNSFDVYMHDTPADALFARPERAFSHGCVRLEQPFEFAQWVLRDQPEWTAEKIDAGMHSGIERHVKLATKIPVFIVYQTAWVEDDGTVVFAKDIYKHDERQASLLPAAPLAGPNTVDAVAAK